MGKRKKGSSQSHNPPNPVRLLIETNQCVTRDYHTNTCWSYDFQVKNSCVLHQPDAGPRRPVWNIYQCAPLKTSLRASLQRYRYYKKNTVAILHWTSTSTYNHIRITGELPTISKGQQPGIVDRNKVVQPNEVKLDFYRSDSHRLGSRLTLEYGPNARSIKSKWYFTFESQWSSNYCFTLHVWWPQSAFDECKVWITLTSRRVISSYGCCLSAYTNWWLNPERGKMPLTVNDAWSHRTVVTRDHWSHSNIPVDWILDQIGPTKYNALLEIPLRDTPDTPVQAIFSEPMYLLHPCPLYLSRHWWNGGHTDRIL